MRWRIIIEGDGPMPGGRAEEIITAAEVPIVVPPVPRPPVVVVPDAGGPFAWPEEPRGLNDGAEKRSAWTWHDPATGDGYYVQLAEFANPLPMSHGFAGWTLEPGANGIPGGHRLWAPRAGDAAVARRILSGQLP
jgi:hypothetical protein